VYFVLLMLLFNMELDDGYTPDENGETVSKKMFYGTPPIIRIEDGEWGYIRILFLPVCACIFLPLFLVAKQLLLVSLTKLVDDDDEARFALEPDYRWVERLPKCMQWLFSTARHDLGTDKETKKKKYGEACKESDLDHIISLKIHPDKRTKNVQGHVEKTIKKHVEKTAANKDEDAKRKRTKSIGRFFKKKEATEKEEENQEAGPSNPTAAVASTKDAVQASSFAQGPAAAPKEESQEHQTRLLPLE